MEVQQAYGDTGTTRRSSDLEAIGMVRTSQKLLSLRRGLGLGVGNWGEEAVVAGHMTTGYRADNSLADCSSRYRTDERPGTRTTRLFVVGA